jgi:hypothetical protein
MGRGLFLGRSAEAPERWLLDFVVWVRGRRVKPTARAENGSIIPEQAIRTGRGFAAKHPTATIGAGTPKFAFWEKREAD